MPRTPAQVRRDIAAVLPLDLIGPHPGHPLERELLTQAPSRWHRWAPCGLGGAGQAAVPG